jgi:hypothetical protein
MDPATHGENNSRRALRRRIASIIVTKRVFDSCAVEMHGLITPPPSGFRFRITPDRARIWDFMCGCLSSDVINARYKINDVAIAWFRFDDDGQ